MTVSDIPEGHFPSRFKRWFYEGQIEKVAGPHESELHTHSHTWWQVMCLTGVDYFSIPDPSRRPSVHVGG